VSDDHFVHCRHCGVGLNVRCDEDEEIERLRARVAEMEGALAEIRGCVAEPCWEQDGCRQTAGLPRHEWCTRCVASAALDSEGAERRRA
jgi:hypothetical protein